MKTRRRWTPTHKPVKQVEKHEPSVVTDRVLDVMRFGPKLEPPQPSTDEGQDPRLAAAGIRQIAPTPFEDSNVTDINRARFNRRW
jgi:hypothetical protein